MNRRPRTVVAVVATAVLLTACGGASTQSDVGEFGLEARVEEVVDGDTVRLVIDGRSETVRLIGVDTPETKHPTKPVECYGPEASAHLATLLPAGTVVGVTRDAESRDRYGRLLAYLFRADDGLFVNLDLVEGGWATTLAIEPNIAHAEEFAAAAERARASSLGLWGACER